MNKSMHWEFSLILNLIEILSVEPRGPGILTPKTWIFFPTSLMIYDMIPCPHPTNDFSIEIQIRQKFEVL